MTIQSLQKIPELPRIKLAVVGHIEWVTFLQVKGLPKPGEIIHSTNYKEEPAGGGAVAAVQMSELVKEPVHLFTSLGKDDIGQTSYKRLKQLGLEVHVAWREEPTRKGVSFVDQKGERTITVIGNRLEPKSTDSLPWDLLKEFDGIFITAGDVNVIQRCREAKKLVATPRVRIKKLQDANVELDALISSAFDQNESVPKNGIKPKPKLEIRTEGSLGGIAIPGGRYQALKLNKPIIDSYGCGDSFAAGVTVGLAAGWEINDCVNLGAFCGAKCATYFGPYI